MYFLEVEGTIPNEPETRNQGKIEVENILQPFHSSSRFVGKDLNQVRASLISGGLEGIFVESLDAILDAEIDLCAGKSAVDAGGSLGGVTTEEILGGVVSG